jgi:transposase, IS30 family
MSYTQLTQEQRYQIYALLKIGHNQTEIAEVIGSHKSTISRELRRNCGQRGYRPKQAHFKALNRHRHRRVRILQETWDTIEAKLRLDWSPEQISGWLRKNRAIQVSHEWIYQHVLADKWMGGTLFHHLRCQKKRHKRYGGYDRRGQLPNRVSIEKRPAIVEQRKRLGDWEVDTLVGKGHHQAIVTLVDRKSRFVLLGKVEQRTADQVSNAMIDLLQPVSDHLHTITADNGKEFAEHEKIARELKVDFFFAHPYAAWERGSNENMNGLIRQYIPKKRNFLSVEETEVELVMARLNNRPRKCLDFVSPFEVFYNHCVALQS